MEAKRALDLSHAFALLAGDDPRPLLALRECLTCTGTDDALLTRAADNEKTMIMSRWFNCVKLPPAVLEADHAFYNVFGRENPSHLFVARRDGSHRLDLNGAQSRAELWKKMGEVLSANYSKKHEPAIKSLLAVFDDFDQVDAKIVALEGRLSDALEKDGMKSRKVKKLKKQLTELQNDKADLHSRAAELSKLPLRTEAKHARVDEAADRSA